MKKIPSVMPTDYVLEIIFSSMRWLFVIIATAVFYMYYQTHPEINTVFQFVILLLFGVCYMAATDYCLYKIPRSSMLHKVCMKASPIFDFIALIWLVALTGGFYSPLFPIAYLIILHAAVYWRFIGGITTAGLFMIGYTILVVLQRAQLTADDWVTFGCNLLFLLFMGVLGGFIVSRERHHIKEKLSFESIAKIDYLTDLSNHRTFQEHLKLRIEQESPFTLVLADIDHFKQVNDTYGHQMGDHVLAFIGEKLKEVIPPALGHPYRYGGEEFAIIFNTADLAKVEVVLRHIQAELRHHVFKGVHLPEAAADIKITMSFGVKRYEGEDAAQLIHKVDKLLYKAKEQGRNCYVISAS